MAAAAGVEPATCSLGESRSIQLSYATASQVENDLQTEPVRRFRGGPVRKSDIYYSPVSAKFKLMNGKKSSAAIENERISELLQRLLWMCLCSFRRHRKRTHFPGALPHGKPTSHPLSGNEAGSG